VVAWLGKLDEAGRLGGKQAAEESRRSTPSTAAHCNTQPLNTQKRFEFDDDIAVAEPRWVEVNAGGVRVENLRQFGGPWLALHLIPWMSTFRSRLATYIPCIRDAGTANN